MERVKGSRHAPTISDTLVRMRLTIAISLVLCACAAKPRVGVRAGEVLAHSTELGRDGTARLATIIVKGEDTRPSDAVGVALDQPVLFNGASTTLLLLLQGCPPFAGTGPCALVDKSDIVYLRAFRFRDGKPDPSPTKPAATDSVHELKIISGVISLVSLGGMAACIAYCEDNKAAKSVALGGSALLFGLIWAIIGSDVRD
jgi:hypothetical protein